MHYFSYVAYSFFYQSSNRKDISVLDSNLNVMLLLATGSVWNKSDSMLVSEVEEKACVQILFITGD